MHKDWPLMALKLVVLVTVITVLLYKYKLGT
jgi:hypothetical protein